MKRHAVKKVNIVIRLVSILVGLAVLGFGIFPITDMNWQLRAIIIMLGLAAVLLE